jgi:membrane dipeptidase
VFVIIEGDIMKNHVNAIHKNSIIVDAHFDILMDVTMQRERGRSKVIEVDHLPSFLEGGVDIIVASIFVDGSFLPEMGLRKALNQVSALYQEVSESPDKIMICKSYADVLEAKSRGKVGFILSFEGVEPLYNDLSLLRVFYELGVRIVGLTWSRRNYAADGSHFAKVHEGKKGGLSEFGVKLIEAAEDMGMFIDVSHINDEGFWDVMEIAQRPIIASHSNCRSVVDSMRNLSDEQIKAIASKNGVIGMNASNMFTSYKDEDGDVKHLLDHVDHIKNLVGVKHVGLGFDFCDDFMKYLSPENLAMIPRKTFDVLKGHKNIPQFTEGLIKRGYSDMEIELILGKNFLRVYEEVLK